MADGARKERWNHTAALRADIHNILRERPLSPARFHPYRKRPQKPGPKPLKGSIEILKYLFVDRRDWARPG